MKKIKLLCIILCVCFLAGCDFVYNVNIESGIVREDNQIIINNNFDIENTILNLIHKYTGPTDSLGMYKSKQLEQGMSYMMDYNFLEYNDSITLSLCYDAYKVINNSEVINISTSKEFLCFNKYKELDSVTINLTSNYKVISNNADTVTNDTYTWYITKENATNKVINIELDKKKLVQKGTAKEVILAIIIIGVIIGIGALIYLRAKSKNSIVDKL